MRFKPGTIFIADERFIFGRKMINSDIILITTKDNQRKTYTKIIREKFYSKGKTFVNNRKVTINIESTDFTRINTYYKIIETEMIPIEGEHLAVRLDENMNELEEIIDFNTNKIRNLKLNILTF